MILDYVKKYEKKAIITSILMIIISIILIAKPEISLSTALTILGGILIIDGIINIISYISEQPEMRTFSSELVIGILLTVTGVIILLNQAIFISLIPIIAGIWIIIRSIMKFQLAINLKSVLEEKWVWILISSIIMFILGIVIIIYPFKAVFTMTRFVGIILLIIQVCNLIESVYFFARVK